MTFTIAFGLAILSVANYGNTFEFSGLDPSLQSKFKSITKPFSPLNIQPRFGEQVKPASGFKNVATKPFGAPFDPFKQSYQNFQPGPFRTNYQPFGPYPGYPGPVVYPGQAPSVYPQPSYRFDNPNNKPFGFQPFSAPAAAQPAFNPYKLGSTKKFNKFPELSDFNQPGKYFQEHQFGAYHGPEFSSAIVPAEHNIKQSKPKDTLLGKPAVPSLSEFGFNKQNPFGLAPPSSFKYPVLQFPQNFQPFGVNTVPSANSIPTTAVPINNNFRFSSTAATATAAAADAAVTTAAAPSLSSEEPATARASEVTDEPSATPAADPQPTGPSQEEVTAEVATVNEAPAAAEQSQQSSPAAEASEPSADDKPAAQVVDSAEPIPLVVEDPAREDKPAAQEADSQLSTGPGGPVVVEPVPETASPVSDPSESSTVSGSDSSATVSGSDEAITQNKPTESEASAVNLPGLPNELYGALPPASDPSFAAPGFPYFGQSAEFQQSPYFPSYYDAPKFSDEELKLFAANFGSDALAFLPSQFVGGESAAVKTAESVSAAAPVVSTESSLPVSSTPLAESVEKVESAENVKSAEKVEGGEKKEPTGGESESRNIPEAPKKGNTVQILQDDPFNGQLPQLYDPSNTASPLDTFKFYSHPSVSALSSQASLASYSPEDAFTNFGTQFRQGYLVEGSPSLTAVPQTILKSSQIAPISISSKDHPLHGQVFKYSQSFVPYPGLVATGNDAPAFRSFIVPSSTGADALPVGPSTTESAANAASSTTETAAESDSAATTTVAA